MPASRSYEESIPNIRNVSGLAYHCE